MKGSNPVSSTIYKAVTLLALLTLLALPALAERMDAPETPLDPNRAAVMAVFEAGVPRARATSALKVSLALTDGAYFTGATWTASVTGAEGACQYLFQLVRFDDALNNGVDLIANQSYSENAAFCWAAVASGSYQVRVWVKDDAGHTGFARYSFEAEDAAYPSIDARAAAIAEECAAAGCVSDYDKALWLHDWLTTHARYDYDYYHYGSDGVLAAGTGVCDSYAKAYLKLLNAAGVGCRYASGKAKGGSHAWNAVCMEGEWYWVDVTWDDPGNGEILSGRERHIYFGVPDEPMAFDHTCTDGGDAGIACTSYICNYFIRTGRVSMWTGLVDEAIAGDLAEGRFISRPGLPDTYPSERTGYVSWDNEAIVYSVTAYALTQRDDWTAWDEPVALEASYDIAGGVLFARVVFGGDGMLTLPGGLAEIGEEAFRGDAGIVTLDVPAGVASIGPGAFADCPRLWRVYIPDSVGAIDETAFQGSPRVCLSGPSGGVAHRFAELNGLNFVEE